MQLREAIETALADYDLNKLIINKNGKYKGQDVIHFILTIGEWKHEIEIVKSLGLSAEDMASIIKSYVKTNLEGPKE